MLHKLKLSSIFLLLSLPLATYSFDTITSNYLNINNLDDVTKSTFKPTPYININGGWGQQTNMPNGGGTFLANIGYRFVESFALEFGYQTFIVDAYNTTQVNNYFSGAGKFYYKINNYVTAAVATSVGISYTNVNNISNQQNAPASYLSTNNQIGGFVAFPVGLMFPIKYVDNLSLKVDYIYALSFSGASQNFVTSGLQYSF
ncbi:hypothetical protein ACFPDQ_03870 [Pseudofrancisella aestuarii]|uniref:Outer membrane protein beta-barrel domain-containing protein n=1 Tax=Pseudofrancisella aestuarii TaxID=2670347 RepID=A0ABV9TAV0_9GAMM|nr:hypothetical protein [Pseudofrancisella aestuarii]